MDSLKLIMPVDGFTWKYLIASASANISKVSIPNSF